MIVNTIKRILVCAWLIATFFASCTPKEDTITDLDGNVYHTVKIGKQTWMVENLKTTQFNNGDKLANATQAIAWQHSQLPAFSVYNNDTSIKKDYGLLYNWYAINDQRGLAPNGWRIPTENDIKELQQFIEMNSQKKRWYLKEPNNKHWLTADLQANDTITGFSALPGGYQDNKGDYYMLKSNGYYWLSFNSLELYHWSSRLYQAFADVRRDTTFKNFGFSVKCIKND
jgi:uncharacterized protein (TIGR02145 family)